MRNLINSFLNMKLSWSALGVYCVVFFMSAIVGYFLIQSFMLMLIWTVLMFLGNPTGAVLVMVGIGLVACALFKAKGIIDVWVDKTEASAKAQGYDPSHIRA